MDREKAVKLAEDVARAMYSAIRETGLYPNGSDLPSIDIDFIVNAHYHHDSMTCAEIDVLSERRRQIEKEGCSPDRDDEYLDGQLSDAAGCYALHAYDKMGHKKLFIPAWWPLDHKWWKPSNPRRNLVKAAALILAEIERLDRAG